MLEIPIMPGRGLSSQKACDLRLEYLKTNDLALQIIPKHNFQYQDIRYNIESFIGSTEIPLGLVGPLLYAENQTFELVYTLAATLEGALVASMNRGAKAISQSGGFSAVILHQKMVRAPMFLLENLKSALSFKNWIEKKFFDIKKIAENYSNHAQLIEIQSFIIGKTVHSKFIFTTGDASGQNMTTTCTWHAMLWIVEHFTKETEIEILYFVIEGNGSGDKKVSLSHALSGRGVHVVAECFLEENIIEKVLRTHSQAIVDCFNSSQAMSKINGMSGYNINAANAIAAIFAATGQDLASIAESANAILNVEKTPEGLYLSLNLPSLVIGTVGGGTHLPKQREALELMKCYGSGKIERFAKMIAGFTLSLEISTYSAIVSGEFAKAHEKLGRNKPVKWLLKSELTDSFFRSILQKNISVKNILKIERKDDSIIDNGIITNITNKVSKKIIGFIPIEVSFENSTSSISNLSILLKSKALDTEVIKGLHVLAASIDTELADFIKKFYPFLEYFNCHLKEIEVYETLENHNFSCKPIFFGKKIDTEREIFIFAIEFLDLEHFLIQNSENKPEKWNEKWIKKTIETITKIHLHFEKQENRINLENIKLFKAWESKDLYKKMVKIAYHEEENLILKAELRNLLDFIEPLEENFNQLEIPITLIHNDFNSRNIAIRQNEDICIYDWELSVLNIPHRDIVEFLSFVLPYSFDNQSFENYLEFHYSFYKEKISWQKWKKGYVYALKEFLVARVSFYATSGILVKYKFTDRILQNSLQMLNFLISQTDKN